MRWGQRDAASWGSIAGELGDQTDLSDELASKLEAADLAGYAPLASPTLTGNPTAPTQAGGNSSTRLATTAFVAGELGSYAPLASPALTGNPTVPTQSVGNNSTRAASTAFVQAEFGARRYVAVFGNNADSSYTIAHNLNAKVIAQVTTTADGAFPAAGVYLNHSSLNAIVVTLLSPPGTDALEIVVIG